MTTQAEYIQLGVDEALADILARYSDSEEINDAIFNNVSGLDIDSDVLNVLQTYTVNNTTFWDKMYLADPGEYTGNAVKDFSLGLMASSLKAQKDLTLSITTILKAEAVSSVTIAEAFTTYLDDLPVKAYIEKATGFLVKTEVALSETTHIPVGKFLVGAGKAVEGFAMFETMRDTVVAMYNATSGEGDLLQPVKEYLIAASMVAGGAALVAITGPASAIGIAGVSSLGALASGWVAETVLDNLTQLVIDAKAQSKTLQQTLDEVKAYIDDKIVEAWDATGSAAAEVLDAGQERLNSLFDGIQELGHLALSAFSELVEDTKDLFKASELLSSPLVLDLDGDGLETTSLTGTSAAYFDHDHNGFAEASGWVNDDDGILAIDLNSDGIINNGSELFGDQTGYANGFLALAQLDNNEDNKITGEDTAWDNLRVWIDANGDGYSQSSELHTLDSLSITQVDLAYTDLNTTNNGNSIKQTSSFTIGGNSRTVSDVYFAVDKTNTEYHEDFELDPRVMFLPTLRGYGNLPDLHIAMSLDNSGTGNLLDLVSDFSLHDFDSVFDETSDISDQVREILFRWAGVDALSPTSRGANVNAQELGFLEKMMGENFLQHGYMSNPGFDAGNRLTETFALAFSQFYARLVFQAGGKELFNGIASYDQITDSISGVTDLNSDKLDDLKVEALGLANTGEREAFWANVVRMIEYSVRLDNLDSGDLLLLDDAIYDSDSSLTLAGIVDLFDISVSYAQSNGTSGNDTLTGVSGNDVINGGDGNDIISAGNGNDIINGGNDNDTMTGGTQDDLLNGGSGNDIYIYNAGDGNDTITDTLGTDKITLGNGFDLSDLTFARVGNSDLLISIDNGTDTGSILIEDQFVNYKGIEAIQFYDTSTYDLTTINWTLNGTAASETLNGVQYGGGINDTIYGDDGNDIINGYSGNDTLYGDAGDDDINAGDGNDNLYDGSGNDKLRGLAGNDTYNFTSGNDVIHEFGGTDAIYLAAGYTSGATVYYKIGNDLKIVLDASNSITIDDHFYSSTYAAETLYFNGGGSVNLTTVSYTLQGDDSNNTLNGSSGADVFYGMGGNDTLSGSGGNDTLYGGTGNDTLYGGSNNDTMDGGAGDDRLEGGLNDDTYVYVSGHDIYEEYNGSDTILMAEGWTLQDVSFKRYVANPYDLILEINTSNSITIENGTYTNANTRIETLMFSDSSTVDLTAQRFEYIGTSGNDTLGGSYGNISLDDIIYGLDGNDALNGGSGHDYLDGGAGNDSYVGGAGNDTFVFISGLDSIDELSGGTDTLKIEANVTVNDISFTTSGTDTTIILSSGVDEIFIDDQKHGTTSYHIEKIEFADGFITTLEDYNTWSNGTASGDSITGTSSHNSIIGKAGNDTLDGAGGDDDIHGGADNDTLYGGSGADLLHGGTGNDTLYGQDGLDTMYGGAGADTFVFQVASAFNNVDVIKDFSATDSDKLNIADLLTGYTSGVSDINDFVSMTTSGGNTTLLIDRDGTGSTYNDQSVATLSGITGLNVDDLFNNGQIIAA